MNRCWVVVAHRAGARLLSHDRQTRELRLVEEMENPRGRQKSSELDTDRPGQAFASAGRGGGHPMPSVESSHDRAATDFARELAQRLREHRNENRFDELVLVAEPRFLGMLRDALDDVTADSVGATVAKDLAEIAPRDLGPHLASALDVREPRRTPRR